MQEQLLRAIGECGVVAIIRRVPPPAAERIAAALWAGGLPLVEITMDSEDAPGVIARLIRDSEAGSFVGAGTVLDTAAAREAIAAGAHFLVAPNLDHGVVETGLRYGRVVIPGVLTPTEIVTALQAGAQIVKVFPAGSLGPEYIRQVRAPLPQAKIMATGGVSADNAGDFIRAGAFAVGLGGKLVDARAAAEGRYEAITAAAAAVLAAVRSARPASG
ncbi:MAG TPA: bifunctional 4-hydroxy-2-oxoglutarate aldolase/2-dehydro-3-deoxy-phosphogluconate aldolase [Bacillota bacterium]|nr:bifunctional 4-hydroxy-2-oxoglutarate aldolase/2-dehydro-3-deoxy-phosphogluconate aldolase [Bacillota bacterium]